MKGVGFPGFSGLQENKGRQVSPVLEGDRLESSTTRCVFAHGTDVLLDGGPPPSAPLDGLLSAASWHSLHREASFP